MSNWLKIVSCLSLLSTLNGWAPKRIDPGQQISLPDTPLNPDQGWFTRESYLLWLCYEDDMDYANKVSEKNEDAFSVNVKLKKPDFNWNSGVRVGIGRYLPNHNLWDVSADVTYFYGSASSSSSPNRDKDAYLTGKWVPIPDFFVSTVQVNVADQGSVNWRLNFFYEDLSVGRQCVITPMITARPFLGFRAVQSYEDQLSRLSDFTPTVNSAGLVIDVARRMKFKGYNDFWGIGPRLGTDFSFKFSNHWSLLGTLSGSFFFGHYKVREQISISLFETIVGQTLDFKTNFIGKDHGYAVRSNLEGSLGLGWEAWVRNHTVRLAPSLMFEASEWFDMNQWISFKFPTSIGFLTTPGVVVADRRHGDLGFIGLTFNFHVDF